MQKSGNLQNILSAEENRSPEVTLLARPRSDSVGKLRKKL